MLFAVIAWFGLSILVLCAVLLTAARRTPKPSDRRNANTIAPQSRDEGLPQLTAAHASRA